MTGAECSVLSIYIQSQVYREEQLLGFNPLPRNDKDDMKEIV
jgi:hypothetical protein